ncbi:MAG TPA: hypothetical protein VGK78_00710 [Nocardioides sp.]|uniref:hypothetical protein n=1 Tax=Nocardioides sp. TaxID=35761 RepID=UPI002F4000B7
MVDMNLGDDPAEVRARWLELREMDDQIAKGNKDPNEAIPRAIARYRLLTDRDRPVIDEVLIRQIESPEEDTRFVALALVDTCRITSAAEALHRLKDWLKEQSFPGAPYEVARVDGILRTLNEPV